VKPAPRHIAGLTLAIDELAGIASGEALAVLERLRQEAIDAISIGFCGDPYVHDCGRADCPTSDSYVKPTP
jgi:hypothetical protein